MNTAGESKKLSRRYAFLWLRAAVSAVGAGFAFVILHQIRDWLPQTTRRTELIFILMVVTLLLLWSLMNALILLVRSAMTSSARTKALKQKSSQSAREIPLSTDIPADGSALDLPSSLSDK